ncbi:hypothetical protein SGADD02_02259 [Streptococcus gallolyticus]|uniref:Uncharacterized protein n=1 Tax=Streptococcus gallolyticus TaxID=315405 RepID=A0A139MG42_9STRE|nr:hypothetical protein SGADD02_02259 [Streptococcus gallolyticus]
MNNLLVKYVSRSEIEQKATIINLIKGETILKWKSFLNLKNMVQMFVQK